VSEDGPKCDDSVRSDLCFGCLRPFVTGDVQFDVALRGMCCWSCARYKLERSDRIKTVGVYVEARHSQRMPGSARKRVRRSMDSVRLLAKKIEESWHAVGVGEREAVAAGVDPEKGAGE